ncbi:MAG: 4Fe-4S dicluster domain-containing protein [Xanthomonadales bacterium]|nr:4Fe-4S dicluster domain-containing protein [Xanthomonadales bacterium]
MTEEGTKIDTRTFSLRGLDQLIQTLLDHGYQCIGPVVRDGVIAYDKVSSTADLPQGWTDEQSPGHYRLRKREDDACFGFVVGPHSWKRFLYPPERRLWQLQKQGQSFVRVGEPEVAPRYAFLGVKACELAAIGIQDQVLKDGPVPDPDYTQRRDNALIIAVNCTESAETCFCASMKTGPEAAGGFDLVLTEILEPKHAFVAQAGSERGREILDALQTAEASESQIESARAGIASAADGQTRTVDTDGLRELIERASESIHWGEIEERCLSCANCTLSCPTCFCSDVEDSTDLTGEHAERWRRWDSCFNRGFSFVAGGEIRHSTASRYRQWMTHKLSTWHDQFGSSGCVGCGRCITWCPVGIDITEEIQQFRLRDQL